MTFEISRLACRQIDKIHAWWTDNRPTARSMFIDEFDHITPLLLANPRLGILYAVHRRGDIRRLLLRQTENHVYYQCRVDEDVLLVLAVQSASRKRGPKF